MKYLNEKDKKKGASGFLLVLIAVMAVAIVVLSIMVIKLNAEVRANANKQSEGTETQYTAEPEEVPSSAQPEQVPGEPQLSDTDEETSEPKSSCCLSTPIADLYIPEIWEDMIKTEDVSEEGCFAVTVYATGDAPEVPLYTIYMGETTAQGVLVGTAVTENGQRVPVSIVIHDIEISGSWDSGEVDTLYAMQESVNEIIQQITELPGVAPAR